MHLSISSSNDRLPTGYWLAIWLGILIFLLAFIFFFEFKIRDNGWTPSVVDSKELWASQRQHASEIGDKAIILVGASRIQLGIDMDTVKNISMLEPIQLAIDGAVFLTVLENLAKDNNIKGTILIAANASLISRLNDSQSKSRAYQWVKYYEDTYISGKEPYRLINNTIKSVFDEHMVTRLEGAKPITVISKLAFQKQSMGNYLITHHNRSRNADYKKVQMPLFYALRVQRHFGKNLLTKPVSFEQFFAIYNKAILNLKPVINQKFLKGIDILMKLIKTLEKRGAKVIMIRFPTDKLIWEMDNKKYPRDIFWNELKKRHHNTIHFIDYPSLSKYHLPDGSHLDYRDKKSFTKALMKTIFPLKK